MSRQDLAGPMTYSEARAARVRKELGGRPGLAEKEMFGGIAFLLGGNMAIGVHGEDLIVRVDPPQTEALLREPGAKPFRSEERRVGKECRSGGWTDHEHGTDVE